MLELQNVDYSVGQRRILNGVSLCAGDGEILVILGKNGSGKTTLLNIIGGALPFGGRILENGTELRALKPSERARRTGLMPQTLPMPHIRAAELVLFGRSPYMGSSGIPSPADREAAAAAMQTADAAQFADRFVDTLSGGERQRCFFAMLLAQDPHVVLLDEPTANLDTEYRELLYRDLRAMRKAGKTVLAVMHHLSEACRIADRICVLHGGGVRFLGTPEEFAASPVVDGVFSMKAYPCADENGETLRFFCAKQTGNGADE